MVRAVLYNICGPAELDDLVQETFIKVWQGLPGFRHGSQLRTWIYRIAANTALDQCRRNARNRTVPEEADPPGGSGGEAEILYRDLVRKGMQTLSPEHRAVLTLCLFEELSVKEAAEALEVPEGTVKSRLHYAKAAMGAFLSQNGVTP